MTASDAGVDLVLPVYNEQDVLGRSVRTLHGDLRTELRRPFRITIADNASTDATPDIAARPIDESAEVTSVRLEDKGRGGALQAVWSRSDATVPVYRDIDLSTGLAALPVLLAPLITRHSEPAIGTRLAPGSQVADLRGVARLLPRPPPRLRPTTRPYELARRPACGS